MVHQGTKGPTNIGRDCCWSHLGRNTSGKLHSATSASSGPSRHFLPAKRRSPKPACGIDCRDIHPKLLQLHQAQPTNYWHVQRRFWHAPHELQGYLHHLQQGCFHAPNELQEQLHLPLWYNNLPAGTTPKGRLHDRKGSMPTAVVLLRQPVVLQHRPSSRNQGQSPWWTMRSLDLK